MTSRHTFEYAIEVRFHHHAGSKQSDSLEATPLYLKSCYVEQVDHGNRRYLP